MKNITSSKFIRFFFPLITLSFVIFNYSYIPVHDDWDAKIGFSAKFLSTLNLSLFFDFHNEHPIALGKLIFLLDYIIFSANGYFCSFISISVLFYFAYLINKIIKLNYKNNFLLELLIYSIIFIPIQKSNLIWPFQVVFLLGVFLQLFSLLNIYLASIEKKKVYLFLSVFFAAISPFTLANSFLSLLFISFYYFVNGYKKIAYSFILYFLSFSVYFYVNFINLNVEHSKVFIFNFFDFVIFSFSLAGAFFGHLFMKGNFGLIISVIFGLSIFLLFVYHLIRNYKSDPWTPLNILLFISIGIILLNIILLAYGRSGFELGKSFSSRYAIYSIILVIFYTLFFYKKITNNLLSSKIFRYLFNILFILIIFQYIKVLPSIFYEKDRINKKHLALDSLIHKDYNSQFLSSIYDPSRVDKLISNFEFIEKNNPDLFFLNFFKYSKTDNKNLNLTVIDSDGFSRNFVPNTNYEKIEFKIKKNDKKLIYLFDDNKINVGYALLFKKDKQNSYFLTYLPMGTNFKYFDN